MARKPINQDLTGKICVVTGASSGIGKQIARNLVRMGATVVMTARDFSRGEAAKSELIVEFGCRDRVFFMECDLTRTAAMREWFARFTERFERLDILVQNAGVYLPEKFETPDGFDRVWQTNVLGPHILMGMLRPLLEQSAPSRVVFVSCADAGGLDLDDVDYDQRAYSGAKAYRASKHAQRLLSMSWAEKLALFGVAVNACLPGSNIKTDLFRYSKGLGVSVSRLMAGSPAKAADAPTWTAVAPELQTVNGKLITGRKAGKDKLRKPDEMALLWTVLDRQIAHIEGVDVAAVEVQQRERSGMFNPSGMTDISGQVSISNLIGGGRAGGETSGLTPVGGELPVNPLNAMRGGSEVSGGIPVNPLNAVRGSSESSGGFPVNPLNAVRGSESSGGMVVSSGDSGQLESSGEDEALAEAVTAASEQQPASSATPMTGQQPAGGFVPSYIAEGDEDFNSSNAVFVPALMKEKLASESPKPPPPPPAP
ncbi:MAG: SDR family NAD(P)-dependent oxidoreductase, partial [Myxococcales bacterium]|nr:SDR family NAD(P)-dependent oxidoreductase [Myxococcales bacterium]